MEIPISEELESICFQIKFKNYSIEQWAKKTGGDLFQNEFFCCGFNAQDEAFHFSYFAPGHIEYWFQLTLSEAIAIASGHEPIIIGWPSE